MNKILLNHPIVEASFEIIDQEVEEHSYSREEYHVVRRAIHATADFDFLNLFYFSDRAIEKAIAAINKQTPIIVDVGMVQKGIQGLVNKTSHNPIICALDAAKTVPEGKTRTETGLVNCITDYPEGIYVIGNAPTALLALCDAIAQGTAKPSLVIGAPVGFVSVVESKQALAKTSVPQIRVDGRKGGSAVAGAIMNALLVLSAEQNE
ncbi:MAG: cobalt-precorrin-8X methylmutase [Halothece sp. Uz-M2-17]|nr:cobalt-precorrin-8X methylmutase [Halothece sp. Uz-M2-17]